MKTTLVTSDGTFSCGTAPVQGGLEHLFARASELGFDGIQLTAMQADEIDAARCSALMQQYNMSVTAIATGRIYSIAGCSMGSGDEHLRRKAVAMMKGHVDLADRIRNADGTSPAVIIGAVRGMYKDAATPTVYMNALRQSVGELLTYALSRNVRVIIEAIETSESEAYRGITETAAYIRSFNTPLFMLQLDTMHMRRENQTAQDAAAQADIVYQVDISGDDRRCPAEDDYDYEGLLTTLKAAGYDGWLTFEYRQDSDGDEASAQRGFGFISEILQNI